VNSGGLAADLRPNRFLFVSGKYTHGEYSDDNEQDAFLGKAELRVWNKPYVKLYYNFYAAEWERQVDHGYFCPESFQAHTLGLYTGFEITPRLFCEMQGSTARERQDPTAENPAWFAAAGLRYRLASNWELALRGEYFDARPDEGNGANGYRRTTVFLSLTHNFGGTPGQARETSLPARPGVEY
jgi:hypothetical protein